MCNTSCIHLSPIYRDLLDIEQLRHLQVLRSPWTLSLDTSVFHNSSSNRFNNVFRDAVLNLQDKDNLSIIEEL